MGKYINKFDPADTWDDTACGCTAITVKTKRILDLTPFSLQDEPEEKKEYIKEYVEYVADMEEYHRNKGLKDGIKWTDDRCPGIKWLDAYKDYIGEESYNTHIQRYKDWEEKVKEIDC